jgi:hypothetical protein
MKLPNTEGAIISAEKLRNYLLNPMHRRGGSKARLLIALGYSADEWQRLETAIREQHLVAEIVEATATDYGMSYAIVAPLNTPSGRTVVFRSVWHIDTGSDRPRLITMYPE